MTNGDFEANLSEAYELIEANRIDEARAILKPLTEEYRDNPDVWWLYAHAVDNADEARVALETVLTIDPEYPEAQALLEQIQPSDAAPAPAVRSIKPIQPLTTAPPPPPSDLPPEVEFSDPLDDTFEDDFEFDESDDLEDEDDSPGLNRLLLIAILGVFALVAAAVLGVSLLSPPADPTSTAVADVATQTPLDANAAGTSTPTEAATETDVPETEAADASPSDDETPDAGQTQGTEDATEAPATAVSVTEEPTETPTNTEEPTNTPTDTEEPTETPTNTSTPTEVPFSAVTASLSEFQLASQQSQVRTTSLGETVLAEVCVETRDERAPVLRDVLTTLAENVGDAEEADALGVTLTDCATDTALRSVAVPVENLEAFQAGDLDDQAFQESWVPVE